MFICVSNLIVSRGFTPSLSHSPSSRDTSQFIRPLPTRTKRGVRGNTIFSVQPGFPKLFHSNQGFLNFSVILKLSCPARDSKFCLSCQDFLNFSGQSKFFLLVTQKCFTFLLKANFHFYVKLKKSSVRHFPSFPSFLSSSVCFFISLPLLLLPVKGTVSQKLRPMLLYIIRKLLL